MIVLSYGWSEFLNSGLATLALPCFFVAPGYLAGAMTNVMDFRRRSAPERLLWAVVLSLPLALEIALHPGIAISPPATQRIFATIALLAAGVLASDLYRDFAAKRWHWSPEATVCTAGAAVLCLYCLAAAAPIETPHGLYENAAWQDWSLRIQLVNASLRAGNHPGNPMFALGGVAAPGRYYYYWYVLCAQLSLLTGSGARAALTASCVAAAMALLACVFLSLKHLRVSRFPVRKQCVAALLTGCVMGLDFIPAALRAVLPFRRVYPDPQFWLDDRSPSWLHLILWSPHHVAGVVCCVTGTMLLVRSAGRSFAQQAAQVALAAICFAAAAGTSTFVMGVFSVACVLIAVDALARREWPTARGMVAAGGLSLLMSLPLLHLILTKAQPAVRGPGFEARQRLEQALDAVPNDPIARYYHVPSPGEPAGSPIVRAPRYRAQARYFLRFVFQFKDAISGEYQHVTPPPGLLQRALLPVVMALMFVADFGFFLFILAYRAYHDLLKPLDRNLRIWWLVLLGVGVPGFLLTSAPMQSNNDLGRHAGMCLRFVLLIWAAPLVGRALQNRGRQQTVASQKTWRTRWLHGLAVAAFLLGMAGQLWQVVINRFDMPLVDAGKVPASAVTDRVPHLGRRFEQIRLAMDAAARATTEDAVVQANPHARLAPVYLLYTRRQMAASDDGCNVPFGGNLQDCVPISRALDELFGGSGKSYQGRQQILPAIRYRPEMVTPANFDQVCREQKIAVLVATYSDPAWRDRSSWVWKLQPIYANSTSRVFACSSAPGLR